MHTKPHIQVGVALITLEGRYLITRRKPNVHLGGCWEFPGGKCESSESPADCVYREVMEELGVEITKPLFLMQHYHEYPEKSVVLHFFECSIAHGEPKAIDCVDVRWVLPEELSQFEFPPADKVVITLLRQRSVQVL